MKKVSVVIPCFHVEEFILPLFHNMQEVEKQLNSMNLSLELVCVDDGSKDGTWDELLKHRHLIQDTQVVRLTRNFGAICASNAGLKLVTGDACTIYAADLQDPLALIPEMAQLWLNGEKYITAVRAKKRKDPLLTRIYAKLYYVLREVRLCDERFSGKRIRYRVLGRKYSSVFEKHVEEHQSLAVLALAGI